MKRKLLTTTLVSMSLLSLNLFAGAEKCAGGVCIVDFSKDSSSVKRQEIKKQEIKKDIYEYETILVNNIETIVFSPEKYVMTADELGEHDLEQMKMLNNLTMPVLNEESLVIGCEDNLKAVKVVGVENTYECQKPS